MTCNRLLSFASFLLVLHGSFSLTATGNRRNVSVLPFGFHQGKGNAARNQGATKLDAFSSPALNRPSGLFFKQREDDQSSYSNHRHSASDWLHNVKSIKHSTVLREIRNPVISVAVWGTLVSIVHKLLAKSSYGFVQKLASDMCMSSAPHSFLVSSLGLLLVFRTNSAYQRFAEGRKIWENILTISRNMSRMVNLYTMEVGGERKRRILNLTAAFPYLLRHHIREGCLCDNRHGDIPDRHRLLLDPPPAKPVDTRHEGDKTQNGKLQSTPERTSPCWVDTRRMPWSLFEKKSLQNCARAHNRPLWVCDRIGREMMSIPYGPNFTSRERLSLLGQVDKLSNAIGECERIHQTAVPLNYARHSLRSLTLWLVTLPFALIKDMGMLTGPVMGVISWLLFGVYQIGYSIEDPFQSALRLSILCDNIRHDVLGEADSRYTAFAQDDAWTEEQDEEELLMDMLDKEVPEFNVLSDILPKDGVPLVSAKNGSWDFVGVVSE